jgi:hypothetical protein
MKAEHLPVQLHRLTSALILPPSSFPSAPYLRALVVPFSSCAAHRSTIARQLVVKLFQIRFATLCEESTAAQGCLRCARYLQG